MSRKFLKHYSNFNREILSEFMTRKELNALDIKYNDAKIARTIKRIKKDLIN